MSPYSYALPPKYYTYYTSLLFMLTGLAYRNGGYFLEIPLYFLAWTSAVHHAKFFEMYPGKRMVLFADRSLAHSIAIVSLKYSLQCTWNFVTMPWLCMYYACLLYTVLIYYMYLIVVHTDLHTHATIHVSSCLGLWCLRRIL